MTDDDLYARVATMSKSLESCDIIDAMENRDAYGTILDVMNFIMSSEQRIEQLEQRLAKAESALVLIATPKRPDGTWNRDREDCRDLAAKTVASLQDWHCPNHQASG